MYECNLSDGEKDSTDMTGREMPVMGDVQKR